MIPGVDSAFPPTLAQASAAARDGVKVWGGYFAGNGIYHGWSDADFQRVRAAGLTPVAYCSGWAKPGDMKARGAALGVRIFLDVEAGIRGDGPWVQEWLNIAAAGLYGNCPVHRGRHAPAHQLSAYVWPDPRATWGNGCLRPAGLRGWQWRGTHTGYGVGVDSTWWDDEIGQEVGDVTPDEVRTMIGKSQQATLAGANVYTSGGPRPGSDAASEQFGYDLARELLTAVPAGGPHHHTTGPAQAG